MNDLSTAADRFDRPAEIALLAPDPDDGHGLDCFRDAMELMSTANRCGRPDLADRIEPHLAEPAWLVEHLPAIAAELPAERHHRFRTIPQPKGAT